MHTAVNKHIIHRLPDTYVYISVDPEAEQVPSLLPTCASQIAQLELLALRVPAQSLTPLAPAETGLVFTFIPSSARIIERSTDRTARGFEHSNQKHSRKRTLISTTFSIMLGPVQTTQKLSEKLSENHQEPLAFG